MVTQAVQMMVNDLNRLERAIAMREKAIQNLDAPADPDKKILRVQPHRYVLTLPVTPQSDGNETRFEPVTRSFVVDRETRIFHCTELVATPTVTGTLPDGTADTVSLPMYNNRAFSFEWQIRDSYSDRAWQSDWCPDLLLASGKSSGLRIKDANLPPGTEVSFTLMPLVTSTPLVITNPTAFGLQVSFVGFEVL